MNLFFIKSRMLKWLGSGVLLIGCMSASAVEPLTVSGNQVMIGGQYGSLAGNSLFWSNNGWGGENFYNSGVVSTLKTDWNATVVRAAMGVEDAGGYLDDPTGNMNKVKAVIDAAIANDMYVIVDWHSHHAEYYQTEATAFFQEIATTYGSYDNIIYEIYNEPLNISWLTIKTYAESVISSIRAIDPDNLVVVGTPNWSQDVDAASYDPIAGTNIAYTLHFYAGSHKQALRDKATVALNNGIALFVTEWGTVDASGDGAVDSVSTDEWMTFLAANHISHANWSINDKAEGASALVPGASTTGNWSAADLTESGAYVKNLVSTWSDTPSSGSGSTSTTDLPALIEAENYSSVGYESTPGSNSGNCANNGGGVDVETSTENGCNIGWTDVGEKLNYDVGIADGYFDITLRIASDFANMRAEVFVGATSVGVVSTSGGGWQAWESVTISSVYIPSNAVVSIEFLDGSFNLNYLDVTSSGTSSGGATDMLNGGDFTSGQGGFTASVLDGSVTFSGTADFTINSASANAWDVQMLHDIAVQNGAAYTVCFDAWSDEASRSIAVGIDAGSDGNYTSLVGGNHSFSITTAAKSYSHTFTASATDSTARLQFLLGASATDVTLDNVSLFEGTACN